MRLPRILLRSALALALVAVGAAAWDVATYDRDA